MVRVVAKDMVCEIFVRKFVTACEKERCEN